MLNLLALLLNSLPLVKRLSALANIGICNTYSYLDKAKTKFYSPETQIEIAIEHLGVCLLFIRYDLIYLTETLLTWTMLVRASTFFNILAFSSILRRSSTQASFAAM